MTPKRLLQDRLQLRQLVLDLLAAPLALDEVFDHAALDGPRTVERVQGREVFDRGGLVAPQHIPHAVRFKLEDAGGQARVEDLFVGHLIVERQRLQVQLLAARLLDQPQCSIDDGERGEPEEVHLQQAQLLHRLHVVGGNDFVVLGAMQRNQLGQRLRRNHHAGGMHTGVAHQAFQLLGGVDQLFGLRLGFVGRSQRRRILQRLAERDVQRRRNHLADALNFGVRNVHRAAGILDRGLGCHGAEGNDLRHLVAAVLLGDVFDDFAAPVHAEVDVDVGQADALGIQEALEQQLVLQRIDVGDAQRVGDQRSCSRSAARPNRNVALLGVADEVPDDEEVSGELHLPDHLDLARQTLLVILQRVLQPAHGLELAQDVQPLAKALAADMLEVVGDRVARRHFELRKRVVNFFQPHIAALGNLQRARQHPLVSREHLPHLGSALHEELVAVELQAVGVVDRLARLNADHHVLGVRVVLAEIVAVVGGDQRHVEVLLQLQQVRLNSLFVGNALVLNLQIEIALPENVLVSYSGFARGVVLAFGQVLRNFALQTRRQADQSLRVFGEKFLADARLVIEAVQRRLGNDPDQIAIALVVLRQHDEMVVAVAFGRGAMIFLLADVELATQDRLDARFFGGVDEPDRAEDVAVVGHGDRRHVEFLDALDQALDLASAVEHRVIGVQMKMNEFGLRHRYFYFMRSRQRLQSEEGVEKGSETMIVASPRRGSDLLLPQRTAEALGLSSCVLR